MRNLGKLAGKVLAVIALAACLAPATAFADEAVSFGGGDIKAGDQVYLGAWDGTRIAWDVEGASGGLAVHSTYILFDTQIHENAQVAAVGDLSLETSELYTSEDHWMTTLPQFRKQAFNDDERALTGSFALSGDFGGATRPDGSDQWYWINEPLFKQSWSDEDWWWGTAVHPDGDRDQYYVDFIRGVRPASNFDLTSVLFTSAAEGGKSGGVAAGAFSALSSTSSVSAWKFTLKDSSRAITASAASGTTATVGYSSWTVPVTFEGGGTNTNDYISAILCDGNGDALYYGTVANAKASGTQDMTMPAGLEAGTYTLKVFSEQRNGAKETDYAGAFKEITLTVENVEYTITVSANPSEGGTVEGGKAYTAGSTATVTATPNTGYEFVNWTENGATVADAAESYSFTVEGARTLVANFKLQSFTVTFVDDDEAGSVLQTGAVDYGQAPKYEGKTPTKDDEGAFTYTFAGWSDGTKTYAPDAALPVVTGEATYTAVYDKAVKTATLTFDLAGGTLNGQTGTVTVTANVGDTISLPGAPTREGYTFKFWKGSEYAAGADYEVEGDHEFAAEWEQLPPSDVPDEPASDEPASDEPAKSDTNSKPAIPKTGDDAGMVVIPVSIVAAISLAMLIGSAARRKSHSLQ